MKILVCGDSWSEAWGVRQAWHSYLDSEIVNVAISGICNQVIAKQFKENYNDSIDLVIVGWSGATRFSRDIPFEENYKNEFSHVDTETIKFFKDLSLTDILNYWEKNIETVLNISNVPVIQFSTFGDKPLKQYNNFLEISFLEYLANKQEIYFDYEIPMFEYDWLNKNNYKLTKKFGKRYFNRDWQRACVERETVRPGKYFLPCGHPNEKGHKLWGEYLKGKIDDIFA